MRTIDHAGLEHARGAPGRHRAWPGLVLWALLGGMRCDATPDPDATPRRAPAAAPAPAPAPTRVSAPAPPEVLHTVVKGETLWDIARAYGVSTEQIAADNRIGPDDLHRLREGARLRIVGAHEVVKVATASDRAAEIEALPELSDGAYHRLAAGESLWTLARQYDVTLEALMQRNDLDDQRATQLRVGQVLVVPGVEQAQVQEARAQPSVARARPRVGITHQLARGETIWDVAHAFHVGVGELMAANGLSAEAVTRLREGTGVFVPGVEQDRGGRIRRTASAREKRAAAVAKKLGLGSLAVATRLLSGRVDPRWARAARKSGRMDGHLRWPVANGWFVRGFGSGEGGYHLAMDIMGEIGWNVRAAAPGIVAYAGDGIRGYGNVVLIVHPGGWVTMYAHNSVNFASAGETVDRGAIVAEVGSTGISRGPHVHFELMHGGKNCDPAPLFKPGVRRRDGSLSRTPSQVSWRDPDERPREVQCARRKRHPNSRWVIHEDPTAEEPPPE